MRSVPADRGPGRTRPLTRRLRRGASIGRPPFAGHRPPPIAAADTTTMNGADDGSRTALVSVEAGRLRVRTRRGRDITDVVPELGALAECGHDVLLDGELCARGGRMADFAGLSGRLAGRPKSTSLRVSLIAF